MSEDQGTRGQRRSSPPMSSARPPLTVLFVDADPRRPEALRSLLPWDSSAMIVSSVEAAMSVISRQAPDLIVTDLDLPDGSGLRLIARVQRDPATRHALVMVVTSRATLGDKIAALEAGADDYLVRPVNPERFALHVQMVSRFRRTLRR